MEEVEVEEVEVEEVEVEEVEVEEAEVEEVEVEEEKAETKGQHCCKTMEQWSGICAAPKPQSYFLSQPNVSRTFIQFLNRSLITVLDISG